MIQLINKQPFVFQYENEQYEFVKPYYLKPDDEFRLIKAKVKGSTLGWQIADKFISYNEIKNEYKRQGSGQQGNSLFQQIGTKIFQDRKNN